MIIYPGFMGGSLCASSGHSLSTTARILQKSPERVGASVASEETQPVATWRARGGRLTMRAIAALVTRFFGRSTNRLGCQDALTI